MKRLTVIISKANAFGGVQKVNEILLNRLAESGEYEIALLSVFKDSDELFLKLDPKIKVSYLFGKSFDIRKNFFRVVRGMRRFVRSNPAPDLFIVSPIGYALPFAFAIPKDIPAVFWDHQGFLHGKKFGLDWIGRRVAARRKNFSVVCITQKSLLDYRAAFGKGAKVRQIYNPLSWSGISESKYDSKTKKIISCGRFTPQKGFDMLVEIANKVLKGHRDWQWFIYGDGPNFDYVKEKTREYGLEENLKLMGFSDNLKEEYKKFSVFALTSRYEGFGMVLVEAQSFGLPCISFDCDAGPGEIIEEGKNGALVKCFDLDEYARKLEFLISHANLDDYSKAARESAKNFSQEKFAAEWGGLIKSLIK